MSNLSNLSLKQKVYTFSNPFIEEESSEEEDSTSIQLLEELFFILTCAESSNETPPKDVLDGVLSELFPFNFLTESDYLIDYTNNVLKYISSVEDADEEWNNIYTHLYKILGSFSRERQECYLDIFASGSIILKKIEGFEEVREKYVYRMSKMEPYLKVTKNDLIELYKKVKQRNDESESSSFDGENTEFDFGDIDDIDEDDDFDFGDEKNNEATTNKSNDVGIKIEKLKELKALLDDGVINQEEFGKMKEEIINN